MFLGPGDDTFPQFLADLAAAVMTSYPQVLVNVKVADRHPRAADELAGEIVDMGSEVTGFRVGQRVVAANSAPCGECRAGAPASCGEWRPGAPPP